MRSVQVLSALALRRLLRAAYQPVGDNGTAVVETDALLPGGSHVSRALRQANARAWVAVEVLLAGEELWERAQLTWERSLEEEFYKPIRLLLDEIPLGVIDDKGPEGRRKTIQALQAALASALLTSGPLDLPDLLAQIHQEDLDQSRTEWQELTRLMDHLEQAGYHDLRPLFALRCESGEPLLIVLVAAIFRQVVQADPDLFGQLGSALLDNPPDGILADFHELAVALDRQRSRLDGLLASLREPGRGPAALPVDPGAGGNRLERGIACAQRGDYDQAIGEYTAAIHMDPASAPAFLQRADAFRLKGDYVQALADYSSALRLDPANALALLQRGQVHWIIGQGKEAIADFTAALEIDPKSAVAYHYRGKALADAGDLDGAIVNFSEALRLDPYFAWAHHDSGEAYAAKGNHDRAIADYSEAVRLNPLATLSHLRRGEAYAAKKEYDRAIADYSNALRLDPHNVLGYQSLGVAYRQQGKYEQAATEFTRALELDFSNGRLYLERGVLFQMQGNHQRALIDFMAAAARNPRDAEVYFRRALTLDGLGQRQRALSDLSQALHLKPDHAQAFHARGQLQAARGEADLAVCDYSAALRIDPAFTAAYVNRARALCASARLDEALADCEQALANDPNLTQAYLVRGSVRAQRGDFALAIEDFSRTLRAEPLHAHAYYLRGVAYLKQNDPRQAVVDLSEAIRLDPNHARAYAQRAAVRQAAGLQELALSDLAHAARLDVQLAPAYCRQLGQVHAAMGQYEWAVADYSLALFLDPDNAAAREGRERAWQAYQQAPRKRPGSPRSMQEIGQRVPPLFTVPGQAPVPPASEQGQSKGFRPQDTIAHKLGQGTMEADLSALEPDHADADLSALERDHADAEKTTDFEMHALDDLPGPATADAEDTSFTMKIPGLQPDKSLSIEALVEPEPTAEASNAETTIDMPAMPEESEAQRKAREAAEQANRARLALEFRRAEEERKQKEKEAAKKAAKKPKRRRNDDDDDDDFRVPLWKKGLLVAASIFILYWTGSAALGWFNNPVRTWQPRAAVKGKALMEKGSEPLTGAIVAFHPLTGINKEISESSVGKDGSFQTMLFPGEYAVTIGPSREGISARDAEAVTRIPASFNNVKTSPLKVEVVGGKENSFELRVQ